MASIVAGVKEILQYDAPANINNHVFRLHILTSLILFTVSGILVSGQFFGDPIACLPDGVSANNIPDAIKHTIDTFCWVGATYTVEELHGDDTIIGYQKIEPGVGQFNPRYHNQNFQLYYRWIGLLFFIQAIFFYVTHYLWKSWESGKMAGLCELLESPVDPRLDDSYRNQRVSMLLNYLESYDSNAHNWYTFRFYLLEVANFINVILNIWLTNEVLSYKFWSIGFDIMLNGIKSPILNKLFPTIAKCLRRTFGPSGGVQNHDELCVLPLNSFNKFVFGFIWFWYIALAVISAGWLIFRLLTISNYVKATLLRWKACDVKCSHHNANKKNDDCITTICKLFPHEDWFVVLQLVDNTDPVVIKVILEGLCYRLRNKRNENEKEFSISKTSTTSSFLRRPSFIDPSTAVRAESEKPFLE